MSERDDLFRAVRRAANYHLVGYKRPQEFDANEMVYRMDDLVSALEKLDEMKVRASLKARQNP